LIYDPHESKRLIIAKIVPKQNDEHTERMKVIAMTMANMKKHSKQREEIQEYIERHDRQATRFALGMPMSIFQLISNGIAKFSKSTTI
jgi:hypothetical protein